MASVAQEIQYASWLRRGGTWDKDGNPARDGYAVAVKVIGRHSTLERYVIKRALSELPDGLYVGIWWDGDERRWEVDQTAVLKCREDALLLARILGERYVYDLSAGEEIEVHGDVLLR